MFTTTDPSYQIPSDATLRCNPGDDMTLGPDYEAFGRRQSYQAMATSKTDDGDISRARLTTEQHAQLESEFATRYKPNTEYKKELAEKMGLEFAKVNVSHYCGLHGSYTLLMLIIELVSESPSESKT